MRYHSKLIPKNNVHTLGFSHHLWEIFAHAEEAGQSIENILIPLCAVFMSDEAAEITRQKIAAFIVLLNTYSPTSSVEFLFGDGLFLNSHLYPEQAAEILIKQKNELTSQLNIPFNQLTQATNFLPFTYHPEHDFPEVNSNPDQKAILSPWDKYETPELKQFMNDIHAVLLKIYKMDHPERILLNDDILFSQAYLGFVKTALEDTIINDIGYKKIFSDQFQQFIGSFSLSAMHHLKKAHHLKTSLCRLDAPNDKRTAVKLEVYNELPPETRLDEYLISLRYLLREFCVFTDILVKLPRLRGMPDNVIVLALYGMGLSKAAAYHCLYFLDYFMKAAKLDSRRFLACAEFPLKPCQVNELENNDDTSSNGEYTMINAQKQTLPQTISAPPANGIQTHNGSPSASAGSSGKSDIPNGENVIEQKLPSSSSSSEDGNIMGLQTKQTKSDIDNKALFELFITRAAMKSVHLPDAEERIDIAIGMIANSRKMKITEQVTPPVEPAVVPSALPAPANTTAPLIIAAPKIRPASSTGVTQTTVPTPGQVIEQTKPNRSQTK